jgi:hypothetical protein
VYSGLIGSLLHHVGSYVCSDVLEEHTTSIIRVNELSLHGYISDWHDEMAGLYGKVTGIHRFKSKVHTKLSDQKFSTYFIIPIIPSFTLLFVTTLDFHYHFILLSSVSPTFQSILYLLIHPNSHLNCYDLTTPVFKKCQAAAFHPSVSNLQSAVTQSTYGTC